jgi:hypothetical protein
MLNGQRSAIQHRTSRANRAVSRFADRATADFRPDIRNSKTANNGNAGVVSENSGAVVTVSNVDVDHNVGAGLVPWSGGLILTANNNKVNGNAGGPGSTTGMLLIM